MPLSTTVTYDRMMWNKLRTIVHIIFHMVCKNQGDVTVIDERISVSYVPGLSGGEKILELKKLKRTLVKKVREEMRSYQLDKAPMVVSDVVDVAENVTNMLA